MSFFKNVLLGLDKKEDNNKEGEYIVQEEDKDERGLELRQDNEGVGNIEWDNVTPFIGPILFVIGIIIAIFSFFGGGNDRADRGQNIRDFDYTETTIIKDNEGNVIDVEEREYNKYIESRPY